MFPVFSTITPVYRMEVHWGIASTGKLPLSLLSTILPQIAGNLSFAIVVLMGFIQSIPIDLEESAFIDGCNVFQIYFRIILPVAKPSFATVAIFTFLWSYNDFYSDVLLRRPKNGQLSPFNKSISSRSKLRIDGRSSSDCCRSVLIVYVLLQKNIIKGMVAGAIKG